MVTLVTESHWASPAPGPVRKKGSPANCDELAGQLDVRQVTLNEWAIVLTR
jgi:hypothetical protein